MTDHPVTDARAIAERAAIAAVEYLQAMIPPEYRLASQWVRDAIARGVSTVELHGEVDVVDRRTSPDKGVILPAIKTPVERRAPVQADALVQVPGTIPWSVHQQAWYGYAAAGHGDQSAERIAERGGFGYGEAQRFIAQGARAFREPAPPKMRSLEGWEPSAAREATR